MNTPPLPGFAGTCGQSAESADTLRTKKRAPPITVQFSDVGRDKLSWSKSFSQGTTTAHIAREAKRGGRLVSNDVDAELNDSGIGHIIVGGWRVVGNFTVTQS